MNASRFTISAITLVLISLAWAWDKPLLAWIAIAISLIDLPAYVWVNGVEALRKFVEAMAVVGPPLLFLPILSFHRALATPAAAGGADAELAARFLSASNAMLVCNIAINVLALLWLIAFNTPLGNRLFADNERQEPTQAPPVISQDELDRREAVKKVQAELRAELYADGVLGSRKN